MAQVDEAPFSRLGFARTFLVPLLLVFAIPAFSLWFFGHAEARSDARARQAFLAAIDADTSLSPERKAELRPVYGQLELSRVLASDDPELRPLADSVHSSVRSHYLQFRWGRRLSLICLASALGAFVLSLGFVALSLRSQVAQYYALSVNWLLLKLVCVVQVVSQGALLVGLSFWITALWLEIYAVKLIVIAALLALVAAGALLKATFTRPEDTFTVTGRLLDPARSPELMQKIGETCDALGIGPPDQVVAGIDDNFFVTELPVTVVSDLAETDRRRVTGKTLFVSVSLLKRLERDEAEAVLAHEMAHFSGQDTTYSRKISPLLDRYRQYLQALYEGGVSLPVFHFMHFFWALYQLSLSRLSRARELRADGVAARLTSPEAVGRALVKVAAYSSYRARIERDLLETDLVHERLDIRSRVEAGFAGFLASNGARDEVFGRRTPHPFDSHPPLGERLASVGVDASRVETEALARQVEDSWFARIGEAEELERALWEDYERSFKQFHEEALALRLTPREDWQLELVQRLFPVVTIEGTAVKLRLAWDELELSGWDGPLRYEEIEGLAADEDTLTIRRRGGRPLQVKLKLFPGASARLLATLERYYGRHALAAAHARSRGASRDG